MRLLLICLLMLAWFTASALCAETPKDLAKDYWLGVYLGGQKFGYIHVTVARDKFEGKDVYRAGEAVRVKVESSGKIFQADMTHSLYLDDKFNRVYDVVESHSNDPSMPPQKMEARYGPKSAAMKLTSGMNVRQGVVPITPASREAAISGSRYLLGAMTPAVGKKIDATYPRLSVSLARGIGCAALEGTIEALRSEKLMLDGTSYDTLVVRDKWAGGEAIRWLLASGEIIRQEQSDRVTFIREPKQKATEIDAAGGPEIDTVPVTNGPTTNARLAELDIKITGVTSPAIAVSDSRQSGSYDAATRTAEFHTTLRKFDPSKSVKLPINDAGLADCLADAPNFGLGSAEIKKLSAEIVGSEKDSYKAAKKLADWVYANVTYKLNSTVALSTAAILGAREGQCMHTALLYAALARSAGIPTRFAAGYAYSQKSAILRKHAWDESYVGEWVGLDPMTPTHVVSGEYIKCFESADPKVLRTSIHTLGMKAEIVSYKTEDGAGR